MFRAYSWGVFLLIIKLASFASFAASGDTYHLKDLGVLLTGTNSYAYGINQSAHVVGYWDSITNGIRAFLYKRWRDE